MSFKNRSGGPTGQRWAVLAIPVTGLAAMLVIANAMPAAADPLPYGPDTCINGYVWREARPGDTVCVTPGTRDQIAAENADAGANRDPSQAYGPQSCAQGYVWRQAFDGDTICVTPGVRSATLADNAAADTRKAANHPQVGPAETGTVSYEIYANRAGVEVAEVDIDFLGNTLTNVRLPFQRSDPLPAPGSNLRLRAYGNGQDRIGCRITVNGRQVADVMDGPVAICAGTA